MKYVPFGRTGVDVSVLGFGAMRLPQLEDKTCDYEASVSLLRRGLDLGITYIDTAYVYINGTSEVAVGKAIKGYDRTALRLATKIPVGKAEEAAAEVWRAKFEECLCRFDTPYIDFMHFHGLTWEAFEG
ncbi:MAG: aldo/keto reductase, partial [Anaerolineae bacterium]|nr:aldo/keto reductase [Anaerolineae bacterium]